MTMFLQEQLLRIDSFSYGVEWCTWRFLTGKHLQTAMNSSNPQIFGTCNWPLTAHKLTTCQVRATRVKASVVETEASNHPQNPLRSLVSSIFQPANPWSQSSPCVFQRICIVSSRVFLRHKWRTATWNTKWPRLELFRAKWPRRFFCTKNAPRPRTAMTGSWRPEISWELDLFMCGLLVARDA